MTSSNTDEVPPFNADRSFPYVLLCGIIGTIGSLAGVWIVTALSFAPVVGA